MSDPRRETTAEIAIIIERPSFRESGIRITEKMGEKPPRILPADSTMLVAAARTSAGKVSLDHTPINPKKPDDT